MSHCAPPIEAVNTQPAALSDMSRALVAATFHEDEWQAVLETYGPTTVVSVLKRVLADIGDQEQRRMHGLADARDDEMMTDEEFRAVKRNFHLWKRSIAEVRQKLRLRIAEIQPLAQALVESHQADRRALVILAKRIWLWEEGLEDRLDSALDDCSISGTIGDPDRPRMTLRQLVEDIATRGPVTP